MDCPDIEVHKLDGSHLSLKRNLSEVLEALDRDGCILLKAATDINSVEPTSLGLANASDVITRNIVLNSSVRSIIFATQNHDFNITDYSAYKGSQKELMGRDSCWEEYAAMRELVGVSCTHLGGYEAAEWTIQVDKGGRGETTQEIVTMEANGGDIFMCNHWLRRSLPRPPQYPFLVMFVIVSYLRQDLHRGEFYPPALVNKVVQVAGDSCKLSEGFIVWKCNVDR